MLLELATSFLLKTAKDSLHNWATKEGVSVIDELVKKEPWHFFGRRRAVVTRLADYAEAEVRQPALVALIKSEAKEYLRLPGLLCENSDKLPEKSRYPQKTLKVLPRCAINEAAHRRLTASLGTAKLLQDSQGGSDTLVAYFLRDLVQEFNRQYRKAYENKSPLKIGELRETEGDWTVLALDIAFPWPPATISGHYLVYNLRQERTRALRGAERTSLEGQMEELEAELGALDASAKQKLTDAMIFRVRSKYAAPRPDEWKIA
jgi:hypothetical protein